MGQETGLLFQLFKVLGTWESSGVPNIELCTMMQLIHQKSFENRPLSSYMQELQEFYYSGKRCLPSKDPTYSTKIKLAEQLTCQRPW
jgi:hypothetical protein